MAASYCCTAFPRSDTPDAPASRPLELNTIDDASSSNYRTSDTRYPSASARTEELQEVQQIFKEATLANEGEHLTRDKVRSLHITKHPSIGNFFRQIKLSRQKSKSKSMLSLDPNEIQRTKSELRKTLLSNNGPEAGGYDADAPELEYIETSIAPHEGAESLSRRRGKTRSQDVQAIFPSNNNDHMHSRLSSSMSPPRKSIESHRLRRSYSESSVASALASSNVRHIHLPSFSAGTSSRTWKLAVMESLHISPSVPELKSRSFDSTSCGEWPLSDNAITTDAPERGHGALLRPSEDTSHTGFLRASFDRPWALSHSAKPSTVSAKPTYGLLRESGRNGHRSSSSSVHLYNMRISHHLRSQSSISNTAFTSVPYTAVTSAVPTRAQTPDQRVQTSDQRAQTPLQHIQIPVQRPISISRKPVPRTLSQNSIVPLPVKAIHQQRQLSSSGFATDDVPEDWGHVVQGDNAGSSMYSTAPNSPAATPRVSSQLPRPSTANSLEPCPERAAICEVADENTPLGANSNRLSSSDGAPTITNETIPDNPSTSNLSQGSNTSKVSRFREDFGTSESRKSTKRNSIVNLFTRSKPKRRNNNVPFYDGSVDESNEPRRLQRAAALDERKDASGLFAKAVKAHHDEKSCMYLSPNKSVGQREIFRQRSSSFSRQRGDSMGSQTKEQGFSAPTVLRLDNHRRSVSESQLTSQLSMHSSHEGSQTHHSAGVQRQSPQFSTPIFSNTLTPGGLSRSSPRTSRQSVALDPMEMTHAVDTESREKTMAPSFQLNDVPATVDTRQPTPSAVGTSQPGGSILSFKSAVVDLEDPNLNLGAWSRYPSHTRDKRTGSVGTADRVKTRDFAYDINPMNILEEEDSTSDSPQQGKKKSKKKRRTGLPKSKSMILGKEFIKNYARLIRSPSVEWLTHGKGHRSSISAGGSVEHPELEILPPIFATRYVYRNPEGEASTIPRKPCREDIELQDLPQSRRDHGSSIVTSSGSHYDSGSYDGSKDNNITATERKRRAASSPDLLFPKTAGSRSSDALNWSRHYESCVCLPRISHSMERPDSSEENGNDSGGSNIPLLIDTMLASGTSSANHTPKPSIASKTFLAHQKSCHGSTMSVGSASAASIRASSMDLLKTLAEAEERERKKCLEMLMRARSTDSRRLPESVESEKADKGEVVTVTNYDLRDAMPIVDAV